MTALQRSPVFTPVKAHFVPSQQRGRDVAVYIFPDDHELCYEWFCQLQLVDGVTLLYMCCGCKSLKSRDPRRYTKPVASCRIVDGYFTTDPRNPKRPHFCEPRLTTKATARRLIIGKCNELRDGSAGRRPAAQELDELLARISSEEFGGFSTEERATMVKQIVCPSEYGRDNARRIIQRAQQRARQGDISTVSTDSNDTDPDAQHGLFVYDQKPPTPNVKLYLCIVCGRFREFSCTQIPPFNRRHALVLLAAMMNYKNMSVESAKKAYSTYSLKQKTICKEHYLEAAAPLLTKMVPTTDNIPFDTNLNALHMSEEMVTEDVVAALNDKLLLFEDKERITAKCVTLFLNDTIGYCVEKKRGRRGGKRVGTTGQLKCVKIPKEEELSPQPEYESTGEIDVERVPSPALQGSSAADTVNDSEVIVIDSEEPHSSNEVTEFISTISEPVKREVKERPSRTTPRHNAPITAKKMMETITLTPPTLPLDEILKSDVPWLDRMFVVEGRQLLELFRCCPLCRTDMEASGSSFHCSAEGDNPVVDVHCRVCLEKRGNIGRWKGQLGSQLQNQ
uniref:ULP_PROTEASE domain-containing protein n=1 Tax=Haemonchus contortus TaxID=6289 RepID=A0A7I4YEH0_HAECO